MRLHRSLGLNSRIDVKATALLAIALTSLIVCAARVIYLFDRRLTDDDQTVFWYAAHEFLHLRVREPCFYGQSYNTLLSGIPAALLVGIGVPEWLAVPVVAISAGLTPWLLLAHLSWRSGKHWRASALVAAPLLLAPAYLMMLSLASYNEGLLLVTVAWWLGARSSGVSRAIATFLLVLGVVVSPNSILLAAPVTWVLVRRWWQQGESKIPVAVGALLGVGVKLAISAFYATHPSYNLHPNWKTQFAWDRLADALEHLPRHWGDLAPLPSLSWLHAAVIFVSALWLVRSRRWFYAAVLLGALAVLFGSLGVTKVHDGTESIFFSYARMYLGLPLLTALALVLAGDEGCSVPRPIRRSATLGLLMLFALVALYRQVSLKADVERTMARPAPIAIPVATRHLLSECQLLDQLAQSEGVDWVFTAKTSVKAYGCSALSYGHRTFLFPAYERRTWLLEEASHAAVTQVMLAEAEPELCSKISPSLSCKVVNRRFGAVVLSAKSPQPAIDFARNAGLVVRPF